MATLEQWVNKERTVLVTVWSDGEEVEMSVALRDHPSDIWSPPITVEHE